MSARGDTSTSTSTSTSTRRGVVERKTRETELTVEVELDGTGRAEVETGLGFFDHMLTALALFSRIDLVLRCRGDLEVDDHHTVEDCALGLGRAIAEALGERRAIARFGSAFAPLDEALARAVVDLSGRPAAVIDLGLRRERLGQVACENLTHFFGSLATAAGAALHVDLLRGDNDHHRAEAAFKAVGLALRAAVRIDRELLDRCASGASATDAPVPSSKGAL